METGSVSADSMEEFLGRRVRKHFEGHGYFCGEVLSYNSLRKFFRVTYEDGDKEEIDLTELQEILLDTNVQKNRALKRRTMKKGKPGKKVAVGKPSRHSGSMFMPKLQFAIVQAVRARNLPSSILNLDKDQSSEVPSRSAGTPLQGSKLVAIQDRISLSNGKYFKTLVGSRVRKFFQGHGHFLGTVVAYHKRDRFFKVEYSDGDAEDLHWAELKKILVDAPVREHAEDQDQAARTGDVAVTNPAGVTAVEIDIEEKEGPKTSGDTTSITSDRISGDRTGAEGTAGGNEVIEAKSASHKAVCASVPELNASSKGEVKVGEKKPSAGRGTEETYFEGIRKNYDGIVDSVSGERKVLSAEDGVDTEDGGDFVVGPREKENAGVANQQERYSGNRSGSASRFRGAREGRFEIRENEEIYFPAAIFESPLQSACESVDLKPQLAKSSRPKPQMVKSSRPTASSDVSSKRHGQCNTQLVGRTVWKYFEGFGDFSGKVISYDEHRGYFKVEYSDGDREEVNLIELSEIILAEEFVGWAVWKHFEGFGYFEGEVLSYDEDCGYFTVEYTDGDREELELTELVGILVPDKPAESTPETTRSAGRKRKQT